MRMGYSIYCFLSLSVLSIVSACESGPSNSGANDSLQAVTPQQAGKSGTAELRVTVPFNLKGDTKPGTGDPDGLEPLCIQAIVYQNRLEEAYILGKLELLAKIRKVNGNLATSQTVTTKNPLSVTMTFNGRSVGLNTDRKSTTTGSGGSSTVGSGSTGSGSTGSSVTGVTVQAPSSTVIDEGLFSGTMEFSAGIQLTKPLGNQVVINQIPADETHILQEATNAFYRTPIFCNIMKQCKGLGLYEENHKSAGYCGGGSFSFSSGPGNPGGPGRPGGPGGRP
jgi:hypothetical protein